MGNLSVSLIAFAEMEHNDIRQRIRAGVKAARARGRKGGCPRVMTLEKLRYVHNLMADQTRCAYPIFAASALYHYLHADGIVKELGQRLPDA